MDAQVRTRTFPFPARTLIRKESTRERETTLYNATLRDGNLWSRAGLRQKLMELFPGRYRSARDANNAINNFVKATTRRQYRYHIVCCAPYDGDRKGTEHFVAGNAVPYVRLPRGWRWVDDLAEVARLKKPPLSEGFFPVAYADDDPVTPAA